MDIHRLKRLTGQYTSLSEMWKEVKVDTSIDKSTKASHLKMQQNNKDVKNTPIEKAATDKLKVQAELVDIDDSSITPKEGKKDAAGQKASGKTERQYHTVVIGSNGAPMVSDTTELDTVDVETWGEGYVVVSPENVYVSAITESDVVGVNGIENALFFKDQETAEVVASMFEEVEIRRVTIQDPFSKEFNGDALEESLNVVDVQLVLSEGMREEIQQRIDDGKEIQVSLMYGGDAFYGHLTALRDKVIQVRPTPKTATRHGVQERTVIIPVDVETLHWDEKHANRLVGKARDLEVSKPEQKPAPQQPAPTGKADDPSTWAIDMSSWSGPSGETLAETFKKLRYGN